MPLLQPSQNQRRGNIIGQIGQHAAWRGPSIARLLKHRRNEPKMRDKCSQFPPVNLVGVYLAPPQSAAQPLPLKSRGKALRTRPDLKDCVPCRKALPRARSYA